MTLSAADLRGRTFAAASDGYDRAEVDSCLDAVATLIEDLQTTIGRLSGATCATPPDPAAQDAVEADAAPPDAAQADAAPPDPAPAEAAEAGTHLASGDMAAFAAAVGLGLAHTRAAPGSGSGDAAADADGLSEAALFLAIRLLIEGVDEDEVERQLRDDHDVADVPALIAEARDRATQLNG